MDHHQTGTEIPGDIYNYYYYYYYGFYRNAL